MANKNLFHDKLIELKEIGDNVRLSNEFKPQQVKSSLYNYKNAHGKKISFRRLKDCYLLTLVDFV